MSSVSRKISGLIGIAILLVVVIMVNFVAHSAYKRVDMTEEKLHTLSDGTRNILGNLSSPVQVRFYYSSTAENQPVPVKAFAKRIKDFLREVELASNGMVEIEHLNPEVGSKAEDAARVDGVQGQPMGNGASFYLGIAVKYLDQTSVLTTLSQQTENKLEYELIRAIVDVTQAEKAKIGIMSTLPVIGEPFNPVMAQQGGQKPWMFVTMLKKD